MSQKTRIYHLIYPRFFVVGMRRLELPTSTSRTWRASQLCYIPFLITAAKVQLIFKLQIVLLFFSKKYTFFCIFLENTFEYFPLKHLSVINNVYLVIVKQNNGAIAQLVEQRTENPCVPGSIPGGTTENQAVTIICDCFFVFMANEFVCVTYENAKQD